MREKAATAVKLSFVACQDHGPQNVLEISQT